MNLKYTTFILLIICLTFTVAVSASDINDDNFNLDTVDIYNENIGEVSADSVNMNSLEAKNNFKSNILSDNKDQDNSLNENSSTVTTDNGGIRNISFSDGYNGYCIDMTLHGAEAGESFSVKDTSVIRNHLDNSSVGEYLKILFYNYYDAVSIDKEIASEAVWTFTDRYYKNSSDELVKNVINDYNGGLRVSDHGTIKKINDTHEMVFDFETLISSSDLIQNYFGYKVSIKEIENSTNGTSNDTLNNSTNGTSNDTLNNSTNDTSNDTSNNSTDTNLEDKTEDSTNLEYNSTDSLDDDSVDSLEDDDEDDYLNEDTNTEYDFNNKNSSIKNNNQKGISGVVAGNPLLILIISLILLVFVQFRTKK
ncbi:hypothetical protein [Methanobrevibacter olleyae]|uniref:Adhesin-like protein n=1 Tax=Methanobrevibacter olleyae TaxID=294671 RepID=A0A126QZQ6_METOL|nr:hypothetical protein [Methanobrevibacter olleyae]AMK15169.1 hypothetical protein YLM1_0612 [Methanobrevibacter olleyae]SFL45662.1 hypothetical protein SAMN02910297_00931 [Methanobrevibacter olleyae]